MTECVVPPEGWYCTREGGHPGPCAALPIEAKPLHVLGLRKSAKRDRYAPVISEPLDAVEAKARELWAFDLKRGAMTRAMTILECLHLPVPPEYHLVEKTKLEQYNIAESDREQLFDELLEDRLAKARLSK
jgi:hypothetical protein